MHKLFSKAHQDFTFHPYLTTTDFVGYFHKI